MFLAGVPSQRSIPADDLAVLGLDDGERIGDVIAFLMELQSREVIFAGAVE